MKKGFQPPTGLLDPISESKISAFNKNFNNTPLRLGVVTKVHEIDDETNTSKLFPEYDIVTSEQNQMAGQGFVEYTNCISMDSLGGLSDYFEKKLREPEKEEVRKSYDFSKQDGSMVLMLCLDGFSDKGIIVGGMPHAGRKTNLTKEAGLHLQGEYNGLNWKIDKEGSLKIEFKSKTDNAGKPQDETAGGTFFQIDQKGSINLDTALKEKEATSIKIDKEKKDIGVVAGGGIALSAQKDVALTAEGKIQGKAKGAVELSAEGSARYTAKSSMNIESDGALTVKGSKVTINGEGGVAIDGQQCMINTPKVFVGSGGTPAVIAITKFVGTGNHGAPVTCSAVGPFSSSVFIAS